MELCFIGGGNPLDGELDDVMYHLSHYVNSGYRILIIPFATEELKIEGWFKSAKKLFGDLGINQIKILEYRLEKQDMQKEIYQHNVLFFTGGRPEKLIQCLIEKELMQTVKEFSGLMIGVSAGALIFCKDCIITKDSDHLETYIIKGLGVVDFSVEVHYQTSIDQDLLPLSDNRDIYAIPNGSAIFIDNKVLSPIGNIFRFRKQNKQMIDQKQTL